MTVLKLPPLDQSELWQQTCDLYQQPGMQAACLNWQNEHGANINLALILILISKQGYQFSPQKLIKVEKQLAELSQQTTQLIRRARFNWREHEDTDNYHSIKQALLNCELMFEQQEQALIIDLLNHALAEAELNQMPSLKPATWYFDLLGINESEYIHTINSD